MKQTTNQEGSQRKNQVMLDAVDSGKDIEEAKARDLLMTDCSDSFITQRESVSVQWCY